VQICRPCLLPVVARHAGSSSIRQPAAEFDCQGRTCAYYEDYIWKIRYPVCVANSLKDVPKAGRHIQLSHHLVARVPQFGRRRPNSMIGQFNSAAGGGILRARRKKDKVQRQKNRRLTLIDTDFYSPLTHSLPLPLRSGQALSEVEREERQQSLVLSSLRKHRTPYFPSDNAACDSSAK